MEKRIEVQDVEIAEALKLVGEDLKKRLMKHGRLSFMGPHEILGTVEEEMHELRDAIRSNERMHTISELLDVAVGCVFGVASLIAITRQEKTK